MSTSASDAHEAPGRVRLFGSILAADCSLPGLPVAPSGSDGQLRLRTLRTVQAGAAPVGHSSHATPLGQLTWPNAVTVTLANGTDGDEIAISDTGRFTLHRDSDTITHHAPPACDRAAVALDLIGVVLPYALHRDGAWCVHASAVQVGQGVIAFVASRGTGKSTLATACLQAGCALVADDVVVMRADGAAVTVVPSGVPLRLHERTALRLGADAGASDEWGKVRVSGALATRPAPLSAIYVLNAVLPDAAVERAARAARSAALSLLVNGKITELLGAAGAGEALARCAAIASAVPVYDLAVPRDLARLGEVTHALIAWHADGATGEPSA